MSALHRVANDVLQEWRADPAKDAPLVRALIAATDPTNQKRSSDKEIADEQVSVAAPFTIVAGGPIWACISRCG